MRRFTVPRRVVEFATIAAAAIVAPSAVGVAATVGGIAAPTDGASAEVIAQGIVTFGAGEFHWTSEAVAINPSLAPVGSSAAGFVAATGPVAAIVSSSAGSVWRLGPGEAAFRPAATTNNAVAETEGAASLVMINIDAGPGNGAFAPGAGARDVDLVRAQLAPESSLTVHAEVSALVYVTSGQVETDDTTISSGATTARGGDVMLANHGTETATVLVAAIGRTVNAPAVAPQPDDAPPVSDGSATPPAAPPPVPSPTNTPATVAPTTADPASSDVDQDGLTGADEELRGTDPNSSDTDGDGLDDGFEVFESGTNPTVADTDGDGATDGQEVDAGTNPNLDQDSDGDGVPDSDEILSGGDPFDPTDQP